MIPVEEIISVIKDAVDGKLPVAPISVEWDEQWCGDVPFMMGGWQVVFFNDCGEVDYVDRATSPDGRMSRYIEWERDPLDVMESTTDYTYLTRLEQMLIDAKLPEGDGG